MKRSDSFHAHHSPMGAHASFTVGMYGAGGGMALQKGAPADNGLYVGYRTSTGKIHYLPFMKDIGNDAERFDQNVEVKDVEREIFSEEEISREYLWATDRFTAPGITFEIVTPFFSIPDPREDDQGALKFASCPATFVNVCIENNSKEDWDGFFAMDGMEGRTPLSHVDENGPRGFISREEMGFASDADVREFCHFGIGRALDLEDEMPRFLLGSIAGIRFSVPAGQSRRVPIVLGYYLDGKATFNRNTRYWYTRHFTGLPEVLGYALENKSRYMEIAAERDSELLGSGLSESRQFLIAHATRSYFGSTEWLVEDDQPLWIVNEGEYLMMNTLDLTIDMLFFELRFNPWTSRNVLEQFVSHYSYVDEIFDPKDPGTLYPGGRSFTHDMGIANHFTRPGHSCYECGGLDRACFSYMTCEQLTNWVLCAGVYIAETQDWDFGRKYQQVLEDCLESLLNRDHPDPEKRNGLMGFESSRTEGGGEITTYDSLDNSLGQARNNVYLAGKCWASYLALAHLFNGLESPELAERAHEGAVRAAITLEKSFDESLGFLPAVLDNGQASAIIPAVEALVYPWKMGIKEAVSADGPYAGYVRMLKRHLNHILKPGMCLYEDGGWKLSSSADNSWMSKICLNQYIVRKILGITYGGEALADDAHVQWEVEGSKDQACSDQFASGKPIGSLYYPRIVTNILWLDE